MAHVGIIGLGLVGSALAERFLAADFSVVGNDIDADKRRALKAAGGQAVEDAAEVARRSERILLSLPTSEIAAELLQKIIGQLPGKLVVDTTTGEPETMARLGAWLADHGVEYVDATIAGSSAQVRRGEVVVMLGGSDAAVQRSRDLLSMFAAQWFHLGPVGSGARMKLVVNLVLGLNRAVLAEGLAFAKACGIEPGTALELLKAGPAYSRVMEIKGTKMLTGDFSPEARLAQHHKDVELILAAAEKAGQKLPFSRLHEELLAGLMADGLGNLDNSAVLWAFAPQGLGGKVDS